MANEETSVPVLAVTAAVAAVILLIVLLFGTGKKDEKESNEENDEKEKTKEEKKPQQQQPKKKEKAPLRRRDPKQPAFTHAWLATSLKGHANPISDLDFSQNGKYLASCTEDRSILIWNVKDLKQKDHKSVRANVELDHATKIRFSPDSKAFITCLGQANTIRVFKMNKKDDGSLGNIQGVLDFEKRHTMEIQNIGIASNGRFIMTATGDTTIIIWDLKGEVLATIDTHQMNNSYCCVSPCGRFVGASGFTPNVKVWEVCFDKSGNFREVKRAFELKGHTAGVYSFSFSDDSHRMASISKDGTWKLWDTKVEYQMQQDPYLLTTGKCVHSGPSLISLSPDARTVLIATGSSISVHNAVSGKCEQAIEDVHSVNISALAFDRTSHYFLTTGDKHIHVFNNVTGLRATLQDLEEKKVKATNKGHRERLQQQINEAKDFLDEMK